MMTPEKALERMEVMRDCYEMFFGGNDGAGFETKYKENREAFDFAVRIISVIPEGAVLIDARKLKADLQLYFNEAIMQGVTPETMFRQILAEIDEAKPIIGGKAE